MLSSPGDLLLENDLAVDLISSSEKGLVLMFRVLEIWCRGRGTLLVCGGSPSNFVKCSSQFALHFSSVPPLSHIDGFSFLPESLFIVFHAAACCLAVCSVEILSISHWM